MASVASDDPGRTRKTARNALVGLVTQVVTLAFSFVSRTIFIATLGAEYLGINSVFAGVLSVLSLAELGFTGAFAFALYAPLRAQDWARVGALLRLYRKIFRHVALAVTVLGAAAIVFLPLIIDAAIALPQLTFFYCLFLANSVVSYLFADRVAIITADQRLYVVRAVTFFVDIGRVGLQVSVLLLWDSYAGYLIVQLCASIVVNLLLARKASRLYPKAFDDGVELEKEERKLIFQNVRGTAVYKVSGVLLHGSTPVIISTMLGTVLVGYYANQAMIVGSVVMAIDVVFLAATASVGHLAVLTDRSQARRVFDEALMLTFILHTIGGTVLLVALDDLVGIWLGQGYRLGEAVVLAMILNFYVYGMARPTALFREAAGLFNRARFVLLATAITNLVLAIVLGLWIGLPGILVANPIARILTQAWMEPAILMRSFFGESVRAYLLQQVAFAGLAVLAAAPAVALASMVPRYLFLGVVAKVSTGFLISSLVLIVFLRRTAATARLVMRFRQLLGSSQKRVD